MKLGKMELGWVVGVGVVVGGLVVVAVVVMEREGCQRGRLC